VLDPHPTMILVDTHVHIHDSFEPDRFFDAAYRNFGGQAEGLRCPGGFTPVLLLAEYGAPFFPRLHEYCERSGTGPRRWRAEPAEENLSAWVRDAGGRRMLVVAGRQVVTAERLEVLVLFAPQEVTAGQTAAQTVEAVLQAGALPVLPWSPGKWWGRRGEAVRRIVAEAGPNQLCLGDIKGRPLVWPSPAAFSLARRKGLKILRGSDPLDLPGGQEHVGSYGSAIAEALDDKRPAEHLKTLIGSEGVDAKPFGRHMGFLDFARSQVLLRLRKPRGAARQPSNPAQ